MKPLQEITLFDSAEEIRDISEFVQPQEWIDVSIPVEGLLMNEKLLIKELSQDFVIANTTNIGNFCSQQESIPVFLKLHEEDTVIVGRLVRLVIRNDEIHLRDFRLLKQGWQERTEERVQPKFPVYFTMKSKKKQIRGSLQDISQKGMCVIANIPLGRTLKSVANADVIMTLNINPFLDDFHVCGIIKNFRYLTDSLTRIGLEIFPDRDGFKNLANYTQIRRQEIVEEIFHNFRELLNYRQAYDLRF